MREMVLLGAGASVEAGIPGAYDMTRQMVERFSQQYHLAEYSRVLRFAVGGLLFQQGVANRNPYEGVNIEEVFNAIELLAGRNELEAAPFVGSWHPLIDDLDKDGPSRGVLRDVMEGINESIYDALRRGVRNTSHSASDINRAVQETARGSWNGRAGEMICDVLQKPFEELRWTGSLPVKVEQAFTKLLDGDNRRGRGRIFQETNQRMIQMLIGMVWVENPDKVKYLLPLVQCGERETLTVATLNYDNAIELAGSSIGVPVETGIQSWSESGKFTPVEKGIRLLKLHGSINWSLTRPDPTLVKPLPSETLHNVSPDEMRKKSFQPAVIFGHRNKLTAKGPFLDLLRAFQEDLIAAERLTVIGYSFRDEHINEFIAQWLNANPAAKLRVINGQSFRRTDIPFAQMLLHLLPERMEVIESYAGEGIQRCFGVAPAA